MYNLEYLSKRNLNSTIVDTHKNYYSAEVLQIRSYQDAVISSRKGGGPGVFASEGYVKESDFHNGICEKRQLLLDRANIPVVDEEVVFIGTLLGLYGHVITDNLKHLWILLKKNNLQKMKFVYCLYRDNDTIPEFFFRILELLGKPRNEIRQIENVQRFSKVHIPDPCFYCVPGGLLEQSGDRFFTKEYLQIIDKIKEAAIPSGLCCDVPKKIYLTRTTLSNNKNRDFGEQFIEDTFKKLGYTVISPETMDFFEQVYMFKSCKELATTQGSISLNSVFCDQNTSVVLINKQNYNTPYQLAINQARGGSNTIIDANLSILNLKKTPWVGPFFMYNSKELCKFAGIQYEGIPKREFAKYVLFGLLLNLRSLLNKTKLKRLVVGLRKHVFYKALKED